MKRAKYIQIIINNSNSIGIFSRTGSVKIHCHGGRMLILFVNCHNVCAMLKTNFSRKPIATEYVCFDNQIYYAFAYPFIMYSVEC